MKDTEYPDNAVFTKFNNYPQVDDTLVGVRGGVEEISPISHCDKRAEEL